MHSPSDHLPSSNNKDNKLPKEEAQKLVEIAAEQFAMLFYKQWSHEKQQKHKNNKATDKYD